MITRQIEFGSDEYDGVMAFVDKLGENCRDQGFKDYFKEPGVVRGRGVPSQQYIYARAALLTGLKNSTTIACFSLFPERRSGRIMISSTHTSDFSQAVKSIKEGANLENKALGHFGETVLLTMPYREMSA